MHIIMCENHCVSVSPYNLNQYIVADVNIYQHMAVIVYFILIPHPPP